MSVGYQRNVMCFIKHRHCSIDKCSKKIMNAATIKNSNNSAVNCLATFYAPYSAEHCIALILHYIL